MAANVGIRAAFEKALGLEVIVPEYYSVMGAIGAALLAKAATKDKGNTKFRGFVVSELDYQASSFECQGCPNCCEIVNISVDGEILPAGADAAGNGILCLKRDRARDIFVKDNTIRFYVGR